MIRRAWGRTWRLFAFAMLAVQAMPARAPGQEPEDTVAIVGARLMPGDGAPVDRATVLIRGDRILAVGPDVAVPAGARRIDGAGKVLTPGLIAVGSPIGLVEIGLESSTVNAAPRALDSDGHPDPVRASFDAADGFDPLSVLIPVARRGGITSALATPVGGLVSGTSAWFDLRGQTPMEAMARRLVAVHASVDPNDTEQPMPTGISELRAVLEDARLYSRSRAAYDRRALREMRSNRADLERLSRVLRGEIPLVVSVSRAADILRVLDLSREMGMRLILSEVEEGWRVAERIAEARVPVIVRPLTNMPSTFTRLSSRYDNAALLARAGVRVILRSGAGAGDLDGAHQIHNLRQEAGNAVAEGMDPQAALAAVTIEPARAFGMEGEYGSVRKGKRANLVVWDGDPFELSTRPLHVFIRGEEAPLTSRQTALFERYRRHP